MTRLHYELAGIQEPEASTPLSPDATNFTAAAAVDASLLDPRRSRTGDDSRTRPTLAPYPPFVSIDRVREWIVPSGRDNTENGSTETKPGRFAGYRGNYFLLCLPEATTQYGDVAKLVEALRSRQLVSAFHTALD